MKYRWLIILLLFPISCFSQYPVSVSSRSSSAIIKFIPGELPVNRNSNRMINLISEDALKNLFKTKVIINYTLRIEISQNPDSIPDLSLFIENMAFSGDIHYRGFDLSEVLTPDRINLSFLTGNPSDSSGYRFFEKKNIIWKPGDSLLFSLEMHQFDLKTDSVTNFQLQFFYEDDAMNLFMERIRLIDDYYASSAVLDSLGVMEDKIDLSDISGYPLYFIYLREMIKMGSVMAVRNLPGKLHLENYDPAGYLRKYRGLTAFLRRAQMTFPEKMNDAQILNCTIPVDSLITELIDGIMRYIRWSMLVNERNGRIYREYLETCYSDAFGNDLELIKQMLTKQHPGQDADALLKNLLQDVLKGYKMKAAKLTADFQFAEAFELLQNARRFTNSLPGHFRDDGLDRALKETAGGIYSSYLGIAGNALEKGKMKMAETYLGKAREYKIAHPGFVANDSIYRRIFFDYFLVRMQKCDAMTSTDPEEALQCIREFQQDHDSLSLSIVRDYLNDRISRLINMLHSDTLYRTKYAKELVQYIINNRSLVWANRFTEAGIFADSMDRVIRKEGLNDSLLLASVITYRRAIAERQCWNSRESFELMIIGAGRYTGQKEYLLAAALLDSALMIAGQAAICRIDESPAKDALARYGSVIKYLQRQQLIEDRISKENYEQAIIEFRSNDADFKTNDLQRFGIEQQTLAEFTRKKNIPVFTFTVADFLFSLNDLPGCLQFLKIARYQDWPAKKSKTLQKALAKKLAEQDFSIYRNEDPVALSKKYSEGDSWFRSFDYWYVYRWNELRNK